MQPSSSHALRRTLGTQPACSSREADNRSHAGCGSQFNGSPGAALSFLPSGAESSPGHGSRLGHLNPVGMALRRPGMFDLPAGCRKHVGRAALRRRTSQRDVPTSGRFMGSPYGFFAAHWNLEPKLILGAVSGIDGGCGLPLRQFIGGEGWGEVVLRFMERRRRGGQPI
jgi:hypothetical protein